MTSYFRSYRFDLVVQHSRMPTQKQNRVYTSLGILGFQNKYIPKRLQPFYSTQDS